MTILIVVVLLLVVLLLGILFFTSNVKKYDYKCFLLTVKDQKRRQRRFHKSHNQNIPIETIYGPDTRNIKNVVEYEDIIEPEYYEKAIEMHYNPKLIRPDITYFNVGAIGCFVGHMEFYKRCFKQGLKYAVIFEDNVIIKSDKLYDEIQSVIDEKGDDFEMCFFHCLSRLKDKNDGTLEKVKWISSTKCYLINVENMKQYMHKFFPMDNHIDMKHEDLIAEGARIYYKDMREYMLIDRTNKSLIAHHNHGKKHFFSRQYPTVTPDKVLRGY